MTRAKALQAYYDLMSLYAEFEDSKLAHKCLNLALDVDEHYKFTDQERSTGVVDN